MNSFSQPFPLGAILQVPELLGVRHEGIYIGNGRVIAASKRTGHVREESLEDFSQGRPVSHEYPSGLPAYMVIGNAKAGLGRKWFLWDNCQHFARACHGNRNSPQLEGLAAIVATVFIVSLASELLA